MHHRPLVRIARWAGLALTVAFLVMLVAVYWYGYRPLPQTSGTVPAAVTAETTIARDSLGVPHIRAATLEDALFAQGYATAQDRLWQMDVLRRATSGELSEILGPAGLLNDREVRRLRTRRVAEAAVASMPPAERAVLKAYARGVNEFIRTHLDRLPVEFTLLRYRPRPWTAVDSLLAALELFRALTTTWKTEFAKRTLMASGDPAKVALLYPVRGGGDTQPGSNAWVISGARTASGKPLLASDMHLQYSIPGIWYMVHLQAPGLDVSGVAMPGLPGVIVGHNQRIAWGVTNLGFDVQDLYIENFDPATGRYLYRDNWEQARLEHEVVHVKGAPDEHLSVWVTRHGPVFIDDAAVRMALRWAVAEPGGLRFPMLDLDRARNWTEFTCALSRFPGPAQNFVYADVDGNIGYHAAGRLPVRKGWSGDLPVDGSSGNHEWDGWIPFDQLPSAVNPPSGIIATANQDPFPPQYPYTVGGNFASSYRARQIRALLSARTGWRAPGMLGIQTDLYSPFSHFLAHALVAAWDGRRAEYPNLAPAIDVLRPWNGQMDKDLPAPLIAALAYDHLRRAIAERAAPGKGAVWEHGMAAAVVEKLLRVRPAGWFPDWDARLLRSLDAAVDEGRRIGGNNPGHWRYGDYMRLAIRHPVLDHLPLIGPHFDIGPVAMSGSATTVKQTTPRLGPSMRMVADTADWDRSLLNVVTGESGQPLSRHYKDEWANYYSGESYPMQYRAPATPDVLRLIPAR